MTPELTYFIKVNIAIVLFYLFYRSFCTQDTFFRWRRITLLGFWGTAWIYPLMNLQNWMQQQAPVEELLVYAKTFYLSPSHVAVTSTHTDAIQWGKLGIIIYLTGVILFGLRFLIQLISICRLAHQCRTERIGSVKVRILNTPGGPFSFLQWIFIHPDSMRSEHATKEILTHEQTHAREWHSFDILFSELNCIICWVNPFCWLLKREVRNNLEYQADHQVIISGHDTKSYQYHLLGVTHQKAAATLYNHFNVLPIKKRIMMMNKKRTRNIGRTKYCMFFLLAAILMLLSNIETVAKNAESYYDLVSQTSPQAKETPKKPPLRSVVRSVPSGTAKATKQSSANTQKKLPLRSSIKYIPPKIKQDSTTAKDVPPPPPPLKQKAGDSEKTYDRTEKEASFPGGKEEMYKYLRENITYPKEAREKEIKGKVFIRFIVKDDGSITDVTVVRALDPVLDKEAVRVVQAMPKWNPGAMGGKNVRSYFVLPITFDPKVSNGK